MSSQHILKISKDYSIYVAKNRAIPSVIDGLKHGQRMALWALRNRAERIKTMALTGDLMFLRLYLHGDSSSNSTISLLAAPYKNNVPLINGHGFFGSRISPAEWGAPRYTEVSRSSAAREFVYNDLELVPLTENYDGSNHEPVHFLPLLPTVLLNGVEGIAVGWATSILPRSLKGLIQATQDAVSGSKTIRGLEPHWERYNVSVSPLGPNQYEIHGKVEIVDTSSVRITEIPPGLSVETLRKRLITMEEEESIVDFVDATTETIDILVKFKRGSVKNWSEKDAIKFFKLTEKTTERIVVIDWSGQGIRQYDNPADLVREFAQWRLGWYTKRFEKFLADATVERTYWKLLKVLFDAGFTKRLGTFKARAEMEENVRDVASKAKLVVEDSHVERVMNLPTYRWTKDFEGEVVVKIAGLDADIAEYNAILSSPDRLKKVYLDELDSLKKIRF